MGWLDSVLSASPRSLPKRERPDRGNPLLPGSGGTGSLLDRMAMMSAPVPIVGDLMGAGADAYRYANDPESRTLGNYGMSALGLLPFVPSLAGTFAGVGAKTADVVALAKAKEMAKAKADPVEVWKTTGWTDQFPDKKWRFEIPDDAAKVRANPKDFGTPRLVAESVEHPQYFSAYPELKDMTAEFSRPVPGGRGSGSFGFLEDYPHIKVTEAKSGRKSTTMHELQHAVQGEEGFARGGSPIMADVDISKLKKPMEDLNDILLRSGVDVHLLPTPKGVDYGGITGSEIPFLYQTQDLAGQIKDPKLLALFDKKLAELEKASASYVDPYEAYRRLAGEAEARLTQARIPLTAAERRARPPWLEFDVPLEQQIVRER